MKHDTADQHWEAHWSSDAVDAKWQRPEPDVMRWAEGLPRGARILDLGAGVGRHALWLAQQGFEVVALDAAPGGLAEIQKAGTEVQTIHARMHDLPFEDGSFDHVLSWNVIYHGDEDILLRSIAEIRRVLKPRGSFLGTMLSKRRLPFEQAAAEGREISRNTWVFDTPASDKRHPHYFCSGAELLALFSGFEVKWLEDRAHEKPGSYHWHLLMERL